MSENPIPPVSPLITEDSGDQKIPIPTQDPKGFLIWLRNRFLTGLFVAFPLVVTLWILNLAFEISGAFFANIIRNLFAQFPEIIPAWLTFELPVQVIGFVLTLSAILVFGIFVSHFVGKQIVHFLDNFLMHVPVVNTIYQLTKQIVDAFQKMTRPGGLSGKQVVYIRYPGIKGYLMGFLTGRFANAEGTKMAAVFIPTSPNPITGFVLIFEESDVLISDLEMDTAWRLILSAGLVPPWKVNFPVRPISTIPTTPPPVQSDTTRKE